MMYIQYLRVGLLIVAFVLSIVWALTGIIRIIAMVVVGLFLAEAVYDLLKYRFEQMDKRKRMEEQK